VKYFETWSTKGVGGGAFSEGVVASLLWCPVKLIKEWWLPSSGTWRNKKRW